MFSTEAQKISHDLKYNANKKTSKSEVLDVTEGYKDKDGINETLKRPAITDKRSLSHFSECWGESEIKTVVLLFCIQCHNKWHSAFGLKHTELLAIPCVSQ